jgi:hypothetical protein
MKTFQSIILVALIAFVSVNVTAGPLKVSSDELVQSNANTMVIRSAPTKQAAYQLGQSKLMQLNGMSSQKLSNVLQVSSLNLKGDTLHLKDGGYVTVEERMSASGKTTFVSLVHVDSHYLDTIKPVNDRS